MKNANLRYRQVRLNFHTSEHCPNVGGKFDEAWDFSEGLAAVKIGGKVGFINKAGEIVINPQFDNAGSFSEGLARVSGRRLF